MSTVTFVLAVVIGACATMALPHLLIGIKHRGRQNLLFAIGGFVHLYLGTGRFWLGISGCGVRFATLVINFAAPPNLNFREITALGHLNFFGDTVTIPEGVGSPWTHLSELSSLLILAFVVDATLALWRRGGRENRRRGALVGGSIALFIVLAASLSALV